MDINVVLSRAGIVPVLKISEAARAVPVCRALKDGGLPVAEITFRTDAAVDAIRAVSRELAGDVTVGAGTVLTCDQADAAVDAGAKFIVTPGFNPRVVEYCVDRGYPIFPGCPTTSDIERAMELGLKIVKFFPAEAMGGIDTIRALSAPYGGISFMPTGGINEANFMSYLSNKRVVACGGSWMATDELISGGEYGAIRERTAAAVKKLQGFELAGVSAANAESIGRAFDLAPSGEGAFTTIGGVNISPESGGEGAITLRCNSLDRAKGFLEGRGVAFAEREGALIVGAGPAAVKLIKKA